MSYEFNPEEIVDPLDALTSSLIRDWMNDDELPELLEDTYETYDSIQFPDVLDSDVDRPVKFEADFFA